MYINIIIVSKIIIIYFSKKNITYYLFSKKTLLIMMFPTFESRFKYIYYYNISKIFELKLSIHTGGGYGPHTVAIAAADFGVRTCAFVGVFVGFITACLLRNACCNRGKELNLARAAAAARGDTEGT